MSGHCSEGLDCKFSHPCAADELQEIDDTPSPSDPYYSFLDHWSPVSPLYINPFASTHMAPPSPILETELNNIQKRLKTLTIDTVTAHHHGQCLPACCILDGNTLLPRDTYSDKLSDDGSSSPFQSRPNSPQPSKEDTLQVDARTITRPMSTPPSTTSSFPKVVRVSDFNWFYLMRRLIVP